MNLDRYYAEHSGQTAVVCKEVHAFGSDTRPGALHPIARIVSGSQRRYDQSVFFKIEKRAGYVIDVGVRQFLKIFAVVKRIALGESLKNVQLQFAVQFHGGSPCFEKAGVRAANSKRGVNPHQFDGEAGHGSTDADCWRSCAGAEGRRGYPPGAAGGVDVAPGDSTIVQSANDAGKTTGGNESHRSHPVRCKSTASATAPADSQRLGTTVSRLTILPFDASSRASKMSNQSSGRRMSGRIVIVPNGERYTYTYNAASFMRVPFREETVRVGATDSKRVVNPHQFCSRA